MRKAWILAIAGSLAACGPAKEAPAPAPGTSGVSEAGTAGTAAAGEADLLPDVPQTDYAALAGYPEGWYLSPGWPGEYPNGFAVLDAGITVNGRAVPNKTSPQTVACALPQYANYQLWNSARSTRDKLDFFVATKVAPVTVSEDIAIEYVSDTGMQPLELKAGDQLSYLRYIGEGFVVFGFNGQEYDLNEADLRDASDISNARIVEDQWVEVACGGGNRAWLLYDDVVEVPGIIPSPIVGYGGSSDILPEEVERFRAEAAEMKTYDSLPTEGEPFEDYGSGD